MPRKRKFEKNITDVEKFIGPLKYKDLKRECIIRGMEFDDVLSGDIIILTNWLMSNFKVANLRYELLDAFDDYQERLIRESMEAKGQDPEDVIHPSLRLGYIAEKDEDGNVIKKKRVRTIFKKKRKKRERTAEGVFSGTKKALTFKLQKEGLEKAEVIKRVLKEFPDASEKSIGIWFNKAKKL